MEPLTQNKMTVPQRLIIMGLGVLLLGMAFGIAGSLQYVIPGLFKSFLSFEKIRPLHVSSTVFWILLAASGGVLSYVNEYAGNLFSPRLAQWQWVVFAISIVLILGSYILGIFGGREYWEFHPVLAIPVLAGWLLFAINVVRSTFKLNERPVYVWMWLTGAVGFLFVFTESYLWELPYFQKNIVRDMTVQWKSYGSLVGCWNMLVYGSGMYLMEKISKDKSYARSRVAFALFFLGLVNMMFNWSHHLYALPILPFVKHIGYLISMTELYILGRIIFKWKNSIEAAIKFEHLLPYRFLLAADLWIFLNLVLALLISVPGINLYTHGTHITVAHVMGTTIGINSMILMAVATDVLDNTCRSLRPYRKQITIGLLTANASLIVFLGALTIAGIKRALWQMGDRHTTFAEMIKDSTPYFIVFSTAGVVLFAGFCVMVYPLMKNVLSCHYYSYSKSTIIPCQQ